MKNATHSNFDLVRQMHVKFGLPAPLSPRELDLEVVLGRIQMMAEELNEFIKAVRTHDLADQADSLVDLTVFAMGTAVMMGLPWDELFAEVQRANMDKELVASAEESKRLNKLDLKKPAGWVAPRVNEILTQHAQRALAS